MKITNELKAIIMSNIKKKRDAENKALYDEYRVKTNKLNEDAFHSKEYAELEAAYNAFRAYLQKNLGEEKHICLDAPVTLGKYFRCEYGTAVPVFYTTTYSLNEVIPSVEDQLNRILVKLSYAPDFDGLSEELKALGIEL